MYSKNVYFNNQDKIRSRKTKVITLENLVYSDMLPMCILGKQCVGRKVVLNGDKLY